MNENRKTQPQLWKQFQWLGMLVLAVCLLWCNAARVKAEDIVIQCGDNCYGTLTDTGVLTISGTGAMWDYTYVGNSVFKKYGDNIYKVVIQDGITRIGDHVFGSYSKSYSGEFTKIQSVTIGKGVQEIGDSAFVGTAGMFSIDIPGNVRTIGKGAFWGSAVRSVTLHQGLKTIGEDAFRDTSLTSIVLPDGLSSVENYAFYNSRVTTVSVPEHITIIKSNAFEDVSATFASMDVTIGANAFGSNSSFRVEHGSSAETYAKNYGLNLTYIQHEYNIHLNACGGQISSADKTVLSDIYVGSLGTPVKKNALFLGWYTASVGGSQYTSTTIMPANNVTLYAHWEKVSVGRCRRPSAVNVKTRKAVITVRPVSYVKGYEFSWSIRRDMKKAKVKRTHSTKLTISRLTKNKTYYIRVRAYRSDSTGKRVYGKWSDIRTLRIKK